MDYQVYTRIEDLLQQAQSIRWTDYHQVIELGQQALAIARESDHVLGIVKSLNYVGWGYNRLDLPADSFKYIEEAIQLSEDNNLSEQLGFALINLVYCYMGMGDTDIALRLLERVIEIGEENNYHELLAYGYNDLGVHHLMAMNFDVGIKLQKQGLHLIEEYHLDIPKTYFYLNMSIATLQMGNAPEALEIGKMAYQSAIQSDFTIGKIYALSQISRLYLTLNDHEPALNYAQKAYQVSIDNDYDKHHSMLMLGQVYATLEKYDEALAIYHDIASMIEQHHNYLLPELNRCIAQVHEQRGDYQQAFLSLRQSIVSYNHKAHAEAEKRITILRTHHDLDVAKRKAKHEKNQQALIQAGLEERMKRQWVEISLEKQLELMDIKYYILKRLNDDFVHPLSNLEALFDSLTASITHSNSEPVDETICKEQIKIELQQVIDLLNDTFDVLQLNDPQYENVPISPINPQIFAHSMIEIAETRTHTAQRIRFKTDGLQPVIYQNEDLLEQLIVNLLTNAIKFSQNKVLFQLTTIQDRQLIICVKDHGSGLSPEDQEILFKNLTADDSLGKRMGLAIIKKSVELLNGEIRVHSMMNIGTEFTLTIPLFPTPHNPKSANLPTYHL